MARRIGALALLLVAALAALLVAPAPAQADGFIIIIPPDPPHPIPPYPPPHPPRPPRPPRQAWFPLAVKWHRVSVEIEDQVATTEVDQCFANPNPSDLEGTYIFPLPEAAAVSKFSLFLGGKEVEAELLDRDRAREIYESIVRRMQDPALLEYVGRGAVRARVYPIPARGEARVKISYQQVLPADGGVCEYRYPLSTEKWSAEPLEEARVDVTIRDPKGAVANVFSPTHGVRVSALADGATRASWSASRTLSDRDFVLYFHKRRSDEALGVTVVTHKPPGEDGYFLLLVSPAADLAADELMAKDVVFVLDTSGSMAGAKMEEARAALRYCLESLAPRDRFALIDFSTEVRMFGGEDGLREASAGAVEAALAYVDGLKARGGTDIHGALLRALALEGRPGVPFLVVFVTDGEPTIGVTDRATIEKAVAQARAARPDRDEVRLFVFGCAGERNELDADFLDRLVEANRGAREYVAASESIELNVSRFFDKVGAPVFSNVAIDVPGAEVHDLYPRPVPDLFRGGEVAIVGRYRAGGARAVRLRGKIAGRAVEVAAGARFGTAATAPFLPRLFALRKVAYLLDQIRLHGEKAELKDEVVRLAKEHGILTPYTSWLVMEDAKLSQAAPRPGGLAPAERAFQELRRRVDAWTVFEREAKEALGAGASGRRDEADRAARVAASEAARTLAGAPAPGAAAPPPTALEPGEEARLALDAMGRFATRGRPDGGAGGEIAEKAKRAAETLAIAARDLVREVEGRAFYREGETWVDARVAAAPPDRLVERVVFLSDGYFRLVRERPGLAAALALGPRVRVDAGDRIVEVVEE